MFCYARLTGVQVAWVAQLGQGVGGYRTAVWGLNLRFNVDICCYSVGFKYKKKLYFWLNYAVYY